MIWIFSRASNELHTCSIGTQRNFNKRQCLKRVRFNQKTKRKTKKKLKEN